ncbi:MAG: HAD-IIIC family phosphatase [Novosphingobium sp.]
MLSDLAWLPPEPRDFRQTLASLRAEVAGPADARERLIRLATHRLDDGKLGKLARVASGIGDDAAPLTRVRLGLIGDGTLSLLSPAITGSGLRHGLLIEVVEGSYGSAVQEAADRASVLHSAGLDMALVALDYRLAGFEGAAIGEDPPETRVAAAFQRIRMIVEGLRPGVKGPVLVQTLPAPVEALFGSFDRLAEGSVFAMVEALNRRLVQWAREGAIVLVDIARLAGSIGLENWDDPRHWHASKLAFSPHYIPAYADVVARTIGAVKGKAKKALVLDLDNTLWGGVIGDDGVEGIVLGQGSAAGEAFLAIQRLALDLRGRGVVLAVCSKNEDAAARQPFREHVEMLLRENHIAVFQANWTDKASNLRAIAETLNIGVDALVFLDDNPAEREQVRRELPSVGVPELPDDPALYPRMLAAAGYFDTVAFSDEDRARADLYQSNAERAELMASASDMDSYLASLAMACTIGPVDAPSRARTAQLINKSNQYNLTTRRYTETEVAAAEADPARHLAQVRLSDRFGDHGLIAVLIADKRGVEWEIDSWLMSCRVLGRRVQEATLAHLAAAAAAAGAERLIGTYLPSAKNAMVADHYAKLGFTPDGALAGGGTRWVLDIAGYRPPVLPMRIDDQTLPVSREAA